MRYLLIIVALAWPGFSLAAEKEHEVQLRFCPGLASEVRVDTTLDNGTEADCVTADYGVEVDFTEHWAQAIGQALHYAAILERRPGIILVCKSDVSTVNCDNHRDRLDETISYWNIGMMLWYCRHGAQLLKDCEVKDFFGPD